MMIPDDYNHKPSKMLGFDSSFVQGFFSVILFYSFKMKLLSWQLHNSCNNQINKLFYNALQIIFFMWNSN